MSDFLDPFSAYGDMGNLFSRAKDNAANKTDRPLPQIRGKRIDDVLYVRASDVADALESQAPKENRRLIDKLRRFA